MKAWRIAAFGVENLELADLPIPKPGPGEVLIKVQAVSLNYRDLLMVKGFYNPKLALPRIPCSDGAGEIVEVGLGVTHLQMGDRVAGIFMQNWLEGPPDGEKTKGALGGDIDGMAAQYVVVREEGVVPIPGGLSYEEAATLPCAGVTAWNALRVAGTKSGDTVLIQGTGGVSIFALQFAKMLGARVLGTSGSDEKLARAKTLGLDDGVNYKSTPDWAKWVSENTGGEGADLVVEVGGAGTFQQSLRAARMAGTVAQIGVLTGVEQSLQITPILHKQLQIHGIYVGSRQDFLSMNRAIVQNGMRPVIDHIYSVTQLPEALKMMDTAQHFGKLVVKIDA